MKKTAALYNARRAVPGGDEIVTWDAYGIRTKRSLEVPAGFTPVTYAARLREAVKVTFPRFFAEAETVLEENYNSIGD
jgi:hypothetical protein